MRLGKTLLEAGSKRNLLHSCPICSTLDEDALSVIGRIALERTFEKGEFLMREGDLCTGFFLVISGKVRVFKSSAKGREKALLIAERGMTFGEDALFGQGTFLQCAEATEKTRVLQIPRNEFLNLLRKNPDLSFQVMESLCLWIRRLATSVEKVAFLTAKDKVIQYFLELANRSKTGAVLHLPEKKKDVADQLGITPETLSRVMQDLKQRNLIEVEKRKVTLSDRNTLEESLK